MGERNFLALVGAQWERGHFVSIELNGGVYRKNREIIDATKDIACAYAINAAFYREHGAEGHSALQWTIRDIHERAPEVPVILSGVSGDTRIENLACARAGFDILQGDAVVVHPYYGPDPLQPILDKDDRGVIISCAWNLVRSVRGEFQDRLVCLEDEEVAELEAIMGRRLEETCIPLYQYVAFRVATRWNRNRNCALALGACDISALSAVRSVAKNVLIVIAGVSARRGDAERAALSGRDDRGKGFIVNFSYAPSADPRENIGERVRRGVEEMNGWIAGTHHGEA